MRRTLTSIGTALTIVLALTGCGMRPAQPTRTSREALGTIVSVTAYADGATELESALDAAFGAMSAAEGALSAYPDVAASPTEPDDYRTREITSLAAFNVDPFSWHLLPAQVVDVLDRVKALGVEAYFNPGMLRVIGLYGFDRKGTVPDDAELTRLLRAAAAFETTRVPRGVQGRFAPADVLLAPPSPAWSSFAPPAVGLDLSGAAKGAALDAALDALVRKAGSALEGALLSAGSTTLVVGHKPSAKGTEPWRIGIEDPRDPEKVIGVVEYSLSAASGGPDTAALPGTVSTSGDYQQSFVRDGVRYHHILDPATGKPARGMRSLTVVGADSGLDSDILSTALFVMGIERAEAYAREHGLGLFIVDAEGKARIVPGPQGAAYSITAGSG